MKTHKGMIVPDFIVREVTVEQDGQERTYLEMVGEFDYTSRSFLRYCMTERDLAAPAFREFCERTVLVMRISERPDRPERWVGERFTPEEYLDLVHRCEDLAYREQFHQRTGQAKPMSRKVYAVQYGKAKWPTGGGRAAGSAGKLFYAETDVMAELYAKYLRIDPSRMSAREKVARSPILFGNPRRFTTPPRLMLLKGESGGVAYVSRRYADQEGIRDGDKLWPIKASAVISDIRMDIDMLIPADAIKFEEHKEKPLVMAELMGLLPDLTAQVRSSVPKKRAPRLAFDTLQWLFPEILPLFQTSPAITARLAQVRAVVEGRATTEEILALAAYTDRQGEVKYAQEFQFLQNGQPKEDPRVRKAIFKVAATAAFKALNFRVRGRYGVALPLKDGQEAVMRTMICPPWMLPMRAKVSYAVDNVLAADADWLVGCLGKDYDGDLLIALHLEHVLARIGELWLPDWSNPADQAWARSHMALPEKRKDNDPRTPHQVMVDGLKAYGLIGVATNMAMVVVDALRAQGVDKKTLMGAYLELMSKEVQQFVDGLKYTPGGLVKPLLASRVRRDGTVVQQGMAARYNADEVLAGKLVPYFGAVRKLDFDALAALPEDPALAGSFYYQLSRLFAGWTPYASVDLKQVGVEMTQRHPLPAVIEANRRYSYVKHQQDTAARLAMMEHLLGDPGLKLALIAKCWERRDTRFALALEKWAGLRLIDAYRARSGPAPVIAEHEPVFEQEPA